MGSPWYQQGGVKFSMKTLQHVGHARAKRAFNGVALKKKKVQKNEEKKYV